MDERSLESLLEQLRDGAASIEQVKQAIQEASVAELGFARIDLNRASRQGVPEVVLGESKTPEQIVRIVRVLEEAEQNVLVTRVDGDKAARVCSQIPDLQHNPSARTLALMVKRPPRSFSRPLAVVSAGTSDMPVVEEALVTLNLCGIDARSYFDVGVAGIHRLFAVLPEIRQAPVVICVAGMEGALPSVLGGLVSSPVIAVPTSVGYGASFGGMAALSGMLSGCASGLTVVNIDNGFGAAMAAVRIGRLLARERAVSFDEKDGL